MELETMILKYWVQLEPIKFLLIGTILFGIMLIIKKLLTGR